MNLIDSGCTAADRLCMGKVLTILDDRRTYVCENEIVISLTPEVS